MIGPGLSLRDMAHDRIDLLTRVFALAAVLLPLLVLYSLRHGVIATMVQEMSADPRNRQIQLRQVVSLDPSFLDGLRADPRVAFVVGTASPIAGTLDFELAGDGVVPRASALAMASGPGDPLLGGHPPPGRGEVVLTPSLAARLGGVQAGDRIELNLLRQPREGEAELLELPLTVATVLDRAAWAEDGALLDQTLMWGLEHWQDFNAVPAFGWPGRTDGSPFVLRNFRLYARDMPALRGLLGDLENGGLNVAADRLGDYERVLALDRALGLVFLVVAGSTAAGLMVSLSATLWAGVLRKRRTLSLLRLHGLPAGQTMLFPVIQALGVAVMGWALAVMLYGVVSALLNLALRDRLVAGGQASLLTGWHLLAALGLTLALALAASALAAWRVARIEPGEGLHDS
ncbi:FtsX-like permease family protein [Niveispirillum irakense]|uniref:FtsX-like permease family protein n=1 Tax=Niveispirillum irakense TaxID=34011 RepID=UPI0004184099|nr:FtsX-like permease family protein [Niveispirillum irakense]